MNHKFDELTGSLLQAVARPAALTPLRRGGVGLAAGVLQAGESGSGNANQHTKWCNQKTNALLPQELQAMAALD